MTIHFHASTDNILKLKHMLLFATDHLVGETDNILLEASTLWPHAYKILEKNSL